MIREMLRTTSFRVLIYRLRIDYGFSANIANCSLLHWLRRKSAATLNAESADGRETWRLPIRLLLYVLANLQGPDRLFK